MFSIKKNYKQEELVKIFEGNNQGYVFDKECITSNEFLKYVCVENKEPIGYLVLYTKSDFAHKEGFNLINSIPDNSIYIWHIITKKGHEGRKVATTLINYVKQEYKNYNIYSIVDERNERSNNMHSTLGFKPVEKFEKVYTKSIDTYTLVKFTP